MSAAAEHRTMPSLGHRVRHAIEWLVPWFDRAQADRDRARLREEIAASKAVRARAVATIQQGYLDYAERLRR